VSGLYVFALSDTASDSFRAAGHLIEFVDAGGIYAAAERVDRLPAVSEHALRQQHEIVAGIAARTAAVLPARFGAFMDSNELHALVLQRRTTIVEALALVRGRVQMTVRLLSSDTPIERPVSVAREAATGTEYLQSRREALAPTPLPPALGFVDEAVCSFVRAERREAGRGRVVATMYHLVDAAEVERYKAAIASMDATVPPELTLTVTGPWPPFAFAPDLWA
jgi:hypothetical protein